MFFKKLSRTELKMINGGISFSAPGCGGTCKVNPGPDEAAFGCASGGACPTCSGGVCVSNDDGGGGETDPDLGLVG